MNAQSCFLLVEGAWTTILISGAAILIGIPAGLGVALLRSAGIPLVTSVLRIYISLARATPLITLVLFIFMTLPAFGLDLNRGFSAVLALTLNTTAFNAEIWRAALIDFPKGQKEAARACGMTDLTLFRRIMLPQMITNSLPGLVNEMTFLIKSSPAIAMIGIVDLTRVTNRIAAETYQPLPPILAAGVLYMLIIGVLVKLQSAAERRARHLTMR